MTDKFEGRARMLDQLEKSAYAKGRADERADTCTLLAKWEGFAAKQFETADGTKRRILAETTQNYRDAQVAIGRGEHVKPPAREK